MLPRRRRPGLWLLPLVGVLGSGLAFPAPSWAQLSEPGDSYPKNAPGTGITPISPDDVPPPDTQAPNSNAQGPVRMARIAYVQGNVSWRPDANSDWSKATSNLPMRQG